MDKEEALVEFLKGLRITLNNASVYFRGHPFYIKSVNEFKAKIDTLFTFLSPIKITIAPESLFVDEKIYDKSQLFTELAAMFHIRKIKSIEIRQGVSLDELLSFLSVLALAQKEILRRGGAQNILSAEKNAHCFVEDLDYSLLLRGTGEQIKDAWTYLFSAASQKKDQEAIKQCVENFSSVVGNLKIKDLAEDEELRKSICGFLACLKDEQKDKFNTCSKEMFKAVLKYKGAIQPEQIEKIKAFFKDVNEEQFADFLLDGLAKDDNFDALSLQLFSKLTEDKRQKNISQNLLNKAAGKDPFKGNPRAAKRVKDLLLATDTQIVSEGYRNIIASLLKDISFDKGVTFDHAQMHINYRYILLNLLDEEREIGKLRLIAGSLIEEWDKIVNDADTKYLIKLISIEKRKKNELPDIAGIFKELDKRVFEFIEHLLWEEHPLEDLPYLIEAMEKSASDPDFYLNKIFVEGRLSPAVLKLFFKSFPDKLEVFCAQLKEKRADMDFLMLFIGSLQMLDSSTALELLTCIYSFSNDLIRIEVLKTMQRLPAINAGFLISILQKGSANLKKEALAILSRDLELRKEALNSLLVISSPLGTNNDLLIENMNLIDAAGFKEAFDHLHYLKSKRFFWNRNIRKVAGEILEKWNVR